MPTLQIKIHNFLGTTVIGTQGERHPRRDITASGHCLIDAHLVFSPDHIWFWVDRQDGEDYKANIEIKWVERNLVLYKLVNGDGVKGELAKVFSEKFKGHIDSLPPVVREEHIGKIKTHSIYHIDDFSI